MAVSGALCALVGTYPFSHSSATVLLAFYWLVALALISFAYFLSTLFSKSRIAGTATTVIYAVSMVPGCARGNACGFQGMLTCTLLRLVYSCAGCLVSTFPQWQTSLMCRHMAEIKLTCLGPWASQSAAIKATPVVSDGLLRASVPLGCQHDRCLHRAGGSYRICRRTAAQAGRSRACCRRPAYPSSPPSS